MNEEEMRNYKVETPKSLEELLKLVDRMLSHNTDYGEATYAISIATTAMFNFMCSKIGATGFMASCADMDVIRRTRGLEHGFKIVDLGRLLYPQYIESFESSYSKTLEENISHIGLEAKKRLENSEQASDNVKTHWKMLADLYDKYVKPNEQ